MRRFSRIVLLLVTAGMIAPAVRLGADETPAKPGPTQAQVNELLSKQPVIPKGVVYKPADAAQNRKAIEKLSTSLLSTDAKELPDDLLTEAMICGAGLWRNIKDDAEMKKISVGRTTIQVPTDKGVQELEGKVFQNKDELTAFWKAFRAKYKADPKVTIRRPTSDELTLYWAMIPFDITEPIFMVESKDATLLVHFTPKDLKIAWIDDFKQMRLGNAK